MSLVYPSHIKTFKKFSLLVDEIDAYRKDLPPDERSKSKHLHDLYVRADFLIGRLKRLGDS